MNISVFILGLNDTGLYVARLLKKTKLKVLGFDHNSNNPGFFSKYIISFHIPDPQYYSFEVLDILTSKRKEFLEKPILIAASENYLKFIFNHRDILATEFLFILPNNETLGNIINKSQQFNLAKHAGIDVPEYSIINNFKDLASINGLKFPLIIKGDDQPLWKDQIKEKVIIVHNKDKLFETGRYLLSKSIPFIVQDIIDGNNSNNYEFNALFINGRIIEQNIIQKIYQYPVNYGYGCYVRTTINEKIQELGTTFIHKNNLEGFSNTEFKCDPISGKYYFIETNARVWQQIELTNAIGQNYIISYIYYFNNDTIKPKTIRKTRTLYWIDIPTFFLLFIRFRKQTEIGFLKFIKAIISANYYGLLSIIDPFPFLKSIGIIK